MIVIAKQTVIGYCLLFRTNGHTHSFGDMVILGIYTFCLTSVFLLLSVHLRYLLIYHFLLGLSLGHPIYVCILLIEICCRPRHLCMLDIWPIDFYFTGLCIYCLPWLPHSICIFHFLVFYILGIHLHLLWYCWYIFWGTFLYICFRPCMVTLCGCSTWATHHVVFNSCMLSCLPSMVQGYLCSFRLFSRNMTMWSCGRPVFRNLLCT